MNTSNNEIFLYQILITKIKISDTFNFLVFNKESTKVRGIDIEVIFNIIKL